MELPQVVQSLIVALEGLDGGYEIILVDDGSDDATPAIAARLIDEFTHIRLLTLDQNHGKGFAVRQGVLTAQGAIVVFTDHDLPYGAQAVLDIVSVFDADSIPDIILGSRDHPDSRTLVPYGWFRICTRKIFGSLVSFFLQLPVSDTQCGVKGFRLPVAQSLFSRSRIDDFAFDLEILSLARESRNVIDIIPVEFTHSVSRVRLHRDVPRMLASLFSVFWRFRVIPLFARRKK